jgi:hypothetical protein
MKPVKRYIAQNVFSRCGQAVTRLAEAGLIPRPEMPDSELEVHEWWLVSPQAGRALREAGEPVVEFCELFMWGRTRAPGPLEEDAALAHAAQPPEPPVPTGW